MKLEHVRRHLSQVERHDLAANHAMRGLFAHAEVGVEAGEVGVAEAVIFLREKEERDLVDFCDSWGNLR